MAGPCGIIRRRGRGSGAVALLAAVLAPASAAAVVGVLYLFAGIRELTLETMRATVVGVVHVAEFLRLPSPAGDAVIRAADTLLGAWPVVVAAVILVGVLAEMLITNAFVILAARRVEWLAQADPLDYAARADAALERVSRTRSSRIRRRRLRVPHRLRAATRSPMST